MSARQITRGARVRWRERGGWVEGVVEQIVPPDEAPGEIETAIVEVEGAMVGAKLALVALSRLSEARSRKGQRR